MQAFLQLLTSCLLLNNEFGTILLHVHILTLFEEHETNDCTLARKSDQYKSLSTTINGGDWGRWGRITC